MGDYENFTCLELPNLWDSTVPELESLQSLGLQHVNVRPLGAQQSKLVRFDEKAETGVWGLTNVAAFLIHITNTCKENSVFTTSILILNKVFLIYLIFSIFLIFTSRC